MHLPALPDPGPLGNGVAAARQTAEDFNQAAATGIILVIVVIIAAAVVLWWKVNRLVLNIVATAVAAAIAIPLAVAFRHDIGTQLSVLLNGV